MLRKRALLLLLLVFFIALVPRLCVTWDDYTEPESDERTYDKYAWSIAQNECREVGGSCVYHPLGSFTWRPPGYPLFLGYIYKFIGHSYRGVRVIQAFIGAVNCACVFIIGSLVFGEATGLLAGLVVGLYGLMFRAPSLILSETLFNLLMACFVSILIVGIRKGRDWVVLLAGILGGLATITRQIGLPMAMSGVVLLPVAGGGKNWLKRTFFLAIGVALVVAPVTIKNYQLLGEFFLVSNHGSKTFYRGVKAGVSDQKLLELLDDEPLYYDAEGEPVDRTHYEAAIEYLRRRPKEIPQVLRRKFKILMVNTTYTIAHQRINVAGEPYWWYFLVLLCILGSCLGLVERDIHAVFFLVLIVIQFVTIMMYDATVRYRIPMIPFMAILAAYGLVTLWKIPFKNVRR